MSSVRHQTQRIFIYRGDSVATQREAFVPPKEWITYNSRETGPRHAGHTQGAGSRGDGGRNRDWLYEYDGGAAAGWGCPLLDRKWKHTLQSVAGRFVRRLARGRQQASPRTQVRSPGRWQRPVVPGRPRVLADTQLHSPRLHGALIHYAALPFLSPVSTPPLTPRVPWLIGVPAPERQPSLRGGEGRPRGAGRVLIQVKMGGRPRPRRGSWVRSIRETHTRAHTHTHTEPELEAVHTKSERARDRIPSSPEPTLLWVHISSLEVTDSCHQRITFSAQEAVLTIWRLNFYPW